MRFLKTVAALALASALSACSWFGGEKAPAPDVPEKQLYQEALSAMDSKNYDLAVKKLQLLEARYPFGQYSEQAQLELIYSYFKTYEPDSASAAADRFIRLHPNHANIDYAYYMKGLTAFEKDRSFLARYLPLDQTERDPGAALDSFDSFATLVKRYPNSPYAADAQKRMQYLKNRLAAHEIDVASFYMKRQAWVAAANRGRYVVEHYQETPSVPDALAVMAEAYTELGLNGLADKSRKVLKLNYPDYQVHSFKTPHKSLLETATFGLLGKNDAPPAPGRPVPKPAKPASSDDGKDQSSTQRSWFDRLTFGIFE